MSPELKIVEIRYFAFSAAAVADALQAADREKGGTLHQFPVTDLAIMQDPQFSLALTIFNVTKHEQIAFNAEQVAVALIQYCRLRKIPLPRAGRKSLEVRSEKLCLKIVLNLPYEPLVGVMAGPAGVSNAA